MVKILHVWDQAGVACTLAKYQRKLGHTADVIKRTGFDKFKIIEFYGQKSIKTWYGEKFLKIATKEAEKYDVIHIHDLIKIIPLLRKKFHNKNLILHYHGSVLRKTPQEKREEFENLVDRIFVSTPDLKKFVKAEYMPNPVDVEHFFPRNIPQNKLAVSLMSNSETPEFVTKFLKDKKIEIKLNTIEREKKPVLYKDMPEFLSNYEYFVDLKLVYSNKKPMPAFGLTGLQALSLGLKVINFEAKVKFGMPEEHQPENVISNIMKYY